METCRCPSGCLFFCGADAEPHLAQSRLLDISPVTDLPQEPRTLRSNHFLYQQFALMNPF